MNVPFFLWMPFIAAANRPQHNTHTLKAWLRKGKTSYILTNSGRNRLNINGLYNPHNQEVIVTYHKNNQCTSNHRTIRKVEKTEP
jgi:predicted site-specific integrase-resolvase